MAVFSRHRGQQSRGHRLPGLGGSLSRPHPRPVSLGQASGSPEAGEAAEAEAPGTAQERKGGQEQTVE